MEYPMLTIQMKRRVKKENKFRETQENLRRNTDEFILGNVLLRGEQIEAINSNFQNFEAALNVKLG